MEALEKISAERSFEHVACRYVGECFLVIYQTRKASSFNLQHRLCKYRKKGLFFKAAAAFCVQIEAFKNSDCSDFCFVLAEN